MPHKHDPLIRLAAGTVTGKLVKALGLPAPVELKRESGDWRANEFSDRHAVIGPFEHSPLTRHIHHVLSANGADVHTGPRWHMTARIDMVIFDASQFTQPSDLDQLRAFFVPLMKHLSRCARIVIIGASVNAWTDPIRAALIHALDGFVRSLAKEIGRTGCTANLILVASGSQARLAAPLRFLCSHRSTYVSGRTFHVDLRATAPMPSTSQPLAVVTGAARGLGAATAKRLAEAGYHVVCIDIPAAQRELDILARDLNGSAVPLDITQQDATDKLSRHIAPKGGIDLMVHNAGITRDRTLFRMSSQEWQSVMAVNLEAILRIDAALDQHQLWKPSAREVCLSSISGLAGNVGQANYAASKAALVGYVAARASRIAEMGMRINAVAPGFIETEMTRRIPFMIREVGRRMNALKQGGLPRDVAELVTFLGSPDAYGITGQTIRICGQALMGA
ncbi:3-oxoacyl-ACP reductase [Burkholderiaceae bacterium DAT-1]|nr:3-oxoacyl-ACP reductase [Burkholderiaceae bacterium DAT-1]